MKLLLVASAILLASQAHAEIFKCKDGKGKISYQESPCPTKTVGTMGYVQDMPLEDQMRAQARANQDANAVRQLQAAEEAKRQQGDAARREWAESQRNIALEQEAEKKRQAEKKAEAREKRRSKYTQCLSDGAGGMNCFTR